MFWWMTSLVVARNKDRGASLVEYALLVALVRCRVHRCRHVPGTNASVKSSPVGSWLQ
jgi:hypothetical protein